MITKQDLLNMTFKDIESKMNTIIPLVTKQDEDDTYVKQEMVDKVKTLFSDDTQFTVPYYTNREVIIHVGGLHISFAVSSTKTGKTVKVTRLREKDVKKASKFKFKDAYISFRNPWFEAEDLDNYKVKLSPSYVTGGARVSLKHRKDTIAEMLTKDSLRAEVIAQDEDWKDVRGAIIKNAAQPKLKVEYFKPTFNQDNWNEVMNKTYQANKELIESVIEDLFTVEL